MTEKVAYRVETVKREVKTYVADDGMEFATERECKEYEREQRYKGIEERYAKLRVDNEENDMIFDCFSDGNEAIHLIYLKDETDFETARDYCEHEFGGYYSNPVEYFCEPVYFPCLAFIAMDENYAYCIEADTIECRIDKYKSKITEARKKYGC